jgi:hypothetical protein
VHLKFTLPENKKVPEPTKVDINNTAEKIRSKKDEDRAKDDGTVNT